MSPKTTPEDTLFPERVRAARERLGWTQVVLGEKAGVTESTVNKWERGAREPETLAQLSKLATVLKVSVDWLLGRPDAPSPSIVRTMNQRGLVRLAKGLRASLIAAEKLLADAERAEAEGKE